MTSQVLIEAHNNHL